MLLHTTDVAVNQVMQIHHTYSYVGDNADNIISGTQ